MNERLIKIAHVVAVVLLALAALAFTAGQTWGTGARNDSDDNGSHAGQTDGGTNR